MTDALIEMATTKKAQKKKPHRPSGLHNKKIPNLLTLLIIVLTRPNVKRLLAKTIKTTVLTVYKPKLITWMY